MGSTVKKLIHESTIDFMADVDDPYRQTVIQNYKKYVKDCPEINVFKNLSKMIDDDKSDLSKFICSSDLDWPIDEQEFIKTGGFLDNLTEDQAKELYQVMREFLPKLGGQPA